MPARWPWSILEDSHYFLYLGKTTSVPPRNGSFSIIHF
ncbi:MAG: hypothetical protein AVDCRST_MAG56-4127 [uncultured Cytophagales bacterium]|uniref:Uncharacterized protein n=1 Tax=uncultured Cytophagales bacterium TaxID=158755 RepID=A0A6J4JS58_9SPHI|nr:MAG: hypothetical protein AVDCRST_MAG56-4127 [uncultured Cytophagales bacterium]